MSARTGVIRHARLRSAVAVGACVLGLASGATARQPSEQSEVGWIGLYNAALVGWLENENRLAELCGHADAGASEWGECRDGTMTPKRQVLSLRSAPHETASSKGSLLVLAVPGRGLRAYYRPPHGGAAAEILPDLHDADWGYGPYFHQTFLERRGPWFLLPAGPLPEPAWIDTRELGDEPQVRLLRAGEIIRTPWGDLAVLGLEGGALRARPEQEADMWCEAGDPPPLGSSKEVRIPVRDLYGPTGHLLVQIKYTRGC